MVFEPRYYVASIDGDIPLDAATVDEAVDELREGEWSDDGSMNVVRIEDGTTVAVASRTGWDWEVSHVD